MKLLITPLLTATLIGSAFSAGNTPSEHLVSMTEKAMYTCSVTSTWSSANHPVDYPSDAHNSPPVLVAHNGNYKMFTPGSPVGEGVQLVAETGDPTKLGEELLAAGDDIMSYIVGVPMFFEPQPEPAENRTRLRRLAEETNGDKDKGAKGGDPITARTQILPDKLVFTPEHSMFSAISMLAPSPDWFTSSHGTQAIGEDANGDKVWYKSFKLETLPYDAGTDSGTTFTSEDDPTDPKEGTAQFTTETSDIGIFVNAAGDDVLPVMTWECSIDNVVYTEDAKDDSAGASTAFVGAVLSSLMAGVYLLW